MQCIKIVVYTELFKVQLYRNKSKYVGVLLHGWVYSLSSVVTAV